MRLAIDSPGPESTWHPAHPIGNAFPFGNLLSQGSPYHQDLDKSQRVDIVNGYDWQQWQEEWDGTEETEGAEGADADDSRPKRRRKETGSATASSGGTMGSGGNMEAIVAKAVSQGVAQGIAAVTAKSKSGPTAGPTRPAALADISTIGSAGSSAVATQGGDVLVSRTLLRELIDHCSRLEQSARHAGRLSAGFAQACEQETRVFAEIRSQLETRFMFNM